MREFNSMIKVLEVKTFKQRHDFLNFALKLYKGNENFVPPIYMDEKKIFKKNYGYYDIAEAKYFNAYRDGVMVGRISAILNKLSNEKWNEKKIRFTRFDCIDDQEVACALFDEVLKYAKEKGMTEIIGPMGFSDIEREGLLIEGFEYFSTFIEQYNYDYYQRLIEGCGYVKDVDWIENRFFSHKDDLNKIKTVASRLLEKNNLHRVEYKKTSEYIKKYSDQFFKVIDESYSKLYGTVPMTASMKKTLISNFKLIVKPDCLTSVADENDNLVGIGLVFPIIGKALQKSGGKMTPACLYRLLKTLRKPDSYELGLIGVVDEYKNKGVSAEIYAYLMQLLDKTDVKYIETNLTLEDNFEIHNLLSRFEGIQHKRRRSFIKKVN